MLFLHKCWRCLAVIALLTSTSLAVAVTPVAQQHSIPNTPVLNQAGDDLRFYNDLIKGRTVAINFVFTRCGMVCPLLGFRFGQLRQQLDKTPNAAVQLISISTDPNYDTPARMQAWAEQFHTGAGWTQVTGNKQDIDHLLKSLKAFSADKQDHSSLVLLIDDQRNEWKWIDGASDPQVIQDALAAWRAPDQAAVESSR